MCCAGTMNYWKIIQIIDPVSKSLRSIRADMLDSTSEAHGAVRFQKCPSDQNGILNGFLGDLWFKPEFEDLVAFQWNQRGVHVKRRELYLVL